MTTDPSSDVLERLREAYCASLGSHQDRSFLTEAADTIKRLSADLERVKGALDPWARVAALNMPLAANWSDDRPARESVPGAWPTWGDLKRAYEVLAALSNTAENG